MFAKYLFLSKWVVEVHSSENRPSQKEIHLPSIIFEGRAVKLRGCMYWNHGLKSGCLKHVKSAVAWFFCEAGVYWPTGFWLHTPQTGDRRHFFLAGFGGMKLRFMKSCKAKDLGCTLKLTSFSHLKMDGWHPIFRGELLVSGSVIYINLGCKKSGKKTTEAQPVGRISQWNIVRFHRGFYCIDMTTTLG